MELTGRFAVVYLTEQGFQTIGLLLGVRDSKQGCVSQIVGQSEFGLWVSPEGEKWRRTIGIPWMFIAAIEMEWEGGSPAENALMQRRIGFEA